MDDEAKSLVLDACARHQQEVWIVVGGKAFPVHVLATRAGTVILEVYKDVIETVHV
jgi:hypothetical protein